MQKRISVLLTLILVLSIALLAHVEAAPSADDPPAGAPAAPARKPVPRPAPKPGSKPVGKTAASDNNAASVAKGLRFANYSYDAYVLPTDVQVEAVLDYYSAEMKKAGWPSDPLTLDLESGPMGAFVDQETRTGLAISYSATKTGALVLVIIGDEAEAPGAAPAGPPGASGAVPRPGPRDDGSPTDKADDLDKSVAEVAQMLDFANVSYEAYLYPANVTFDNIFGYYKSEMSKAGWSGRELVVDLDDAKVGAFVDPNTRTGTAIYFARMRGGVVILTIFGE